MSAAGLAMFEGGGMKDAAGKAVAWSIKPTYRGVAGPCGDLEAAGYSAVFLCDVPRDFGASRNWPML